MANRNNIKNVKGTFNYLPSEQIIRNYIQDTLREIFEEYGYKPLETPILSYYDILRDKYDDNNDILHEIYKLSDQGERELGLRYDLTVPFASSIAQTKDIRLPFKRYEIGKVFRDGPVKTGRDREFTQCDVDVVGLDGQYIEAELISIWVKGFEKLNIEIEIKYNNRNLLRGLIKEITNVSDDKINSVVTVIDKLDKLSEDEMLENLERLGLNLKEAGELLDIFKLDLDAIDTRFKDTSNDELKQGLEEVKNLTNILNSLEINSISFTPSLARGQDYYTGNIFEVYSKKGDVTSSIGGGGRYDKMITNFIDNGNIYPAVGISFGLSSIYEIIKNRNEFANNKFIDILVVPINTVNEALKLGEELRNLKFKVEVDLSLKKIKKSFEYADRENIPYIIIYGEEEVKNKKFKLKNMKSKEEIEISSNNLKDIVSKIKK